MMRRRDLFGLPAMALGYALPAMASAPSESKGYNVLEFGAKPDGTTMNTAAIQAAINAATKAGGGVVYLPPGRFLTGGIVLKSFVTLYLEAGAVLLGSVDEKDFKSPGGPPKNHDASGSHLIYAYKAEAITIAGRGTIDGQGPKFWQPRAKAVPEDKLWGDAKSNEMENKGWRPSPLINLEGCRNVRMEGITIKGAPGWTLRPCGCDSVVIDGIRLDNAWGENTDGIDVSGSRNVMIANCFINTGDDAICLKSEGVDGKPALSANITVTNCIITTSCNGYKIGTETHGAYENLVFSNSVIYSGDGPVNERVISGIGLNMVDGSTVDGVLISNIRMKNVRTPIAIRLGTREAAKDGAPPIAMRNVIISGIDAVGQTLTNSITGVPGHVVEDVTIENVRLSSVEKGTEAWADNVVPEKENSYPQSTIFGRFPAYGFYVRHVKRLRLRGLELIAAQGDARPAIVMDDVEDLVLEGLEASAPTGERPVVVFKDVKRAWVYGCRAPVGCACFLQADGEKSTDIVLAANELSGAKTPVRAGKEVVAAKGITVK